MTDSLSPLQLHITLKNDGFLFLPYQKAKDFFAPHGFNLNDWEEFVKSWDNLEPDRYMADGGSYRKRRYATYSLSSANIILEPHQPHYQSRDYNNLNGGIERWFAPIKEETAKNSALQAILKALSYLADKMENTPSQQQNWHTELHQFRIESSTEIKGKPTPEGLHRDGVDYVLILMIKRQNISKGITTIYGLDQKTKLAEFTLENPFDMALIDDHRVFHGVTEIEPIDPTQPAYRDVLVVTLRKKNAS